MWRAYRSIYAGHVRPILSTSGFLCPGQVMLSVVLALVAAFATHVISIPASSRDCERMFSELGNLLEPPRRAVSPKLLAAIQCVRLWRKAGFGPGSKSVLTAFDRELN
jgi:hypothetical protein